MNLDPNPRGSDPRRGIRVSVDAAERAAVDAFTAAGIPRSVAVAVSKVLVDAECRGHSSHGLALCELYIERVLKGGINPHAEPIIEHSASAVTRICANGGFGQLAARLAARLAVDGAKRNGVYTVAVRENNHVGMLAAYREPFCSSQVVGLILNVSGPSVAPPRGARATLGNNAVCLIVPQAKGVRPFICDMATGEVACGKIRARAARGEPVPLGWLLDRHGAPTQDAAALDSGGSVPVFGGHKGLVVHIIVEVLAGMLAGSLISPMVSRQRQKPSQHQGASQLFVAFDPIAFGTPNLTELVDSLRDAVASAYSGQPMLPFFPEQPEEAAEHATRGGLDLDLKTAMFLGFVPAEKDWHEVTSIPADLTASLPG